MAWEASRLPWRARIDIGEEEEEEEAVSTPAKKVRISHFKPYSLVTEEY